MAAPYFYSTVVTDLPDEFANPVEEAEIKRPYNSDGSNSLLNTAYNVVVATLVFIPIFTWFEALRSYFDERTLGGALFPTHVPSWQRVWYAVLVTCISLFLLLLLYLVSKRR